jgi:signal transduction histidine kinase
MLTKKISTRFSLLVITTTLFFGIIFSFLEVFSEYKSYRASIIESVNTHLRSTAEVASEALYKMDLLTAQSLVNGTVANNFIVKSELFNEDGELQARSIEPINTLIWRPLQIENFITEYPISVEGEISSGTHRVEVDIELGLQEFYNRAIVSIIVEFIKILFIALVVYLITMKLIAKPVEQLSNEVATVEPGVRPEKLSLMERNDELGLLASNTYNYIIESYDFAQVLEQKQLERLELEDKLHHSQKMDAIGQLAGGIAHDFNNIMTIVLGNLALARSYLEIGDLAKLEKALNSIDESSERAAKLTKQLLVFSRKDIIEPAIADIKNIIENSSNILARLIQENITMDYLLEDVMPVYTDINQIELILINLVVNAKDAMPEGGNIIVECRNERITQEFVARTPGAREGNYVMFSVTDNGTGIEEELLAHIFEPFFTTKKVGKGTGLGLSTVYGIISKWQGFILTNSEVGKGISFKLYLPALTNHKMETSNDVSALDDATEFDFSGRVLVCEDDDSVRKLIVELLKTTGFEITEAPNPLEAIELFDQAKEPFDLLITDIIMPEMNGRELAHYISTRQQIKTLFVSGYSENVISEHGVVTSDVVFVQKPFTKGKLFHAINKALSA